MLFFLWFASFRLGGEFLFHPQNTKLRQPQLSNRLKRVAEKVSGRLSAPRNKEKDFCSELSSRSAEYSLHILSSAGFGIFAHPHETHVPQFCSHLVKIRREFGEYSGRLIRVLSKRLLGSAFGISALREAGYSRRHGGIGVRAQPSANCRDGVCGRESFPPSAPSLFPTI
jgi:hypothetical protein